MSLDNQIDPYFDLDRDFRKKDYALDSDSFLLFEWFILYFEFMSHEEYQDVYRSIIIITQSS